MIPMALLALSLGTETADFPELSAEDLSPLGCTFRLTAEDASRLTGAPLSLRTRFHGLGSPEVIETADLTLTREETGPDFVLFRLETGDTAWHRAARRLMEDIRRYTELKSAGDDGAAAWELTGLSAEEEYPEDLLQARRELLDAPEPDEEWETVFRSVPETVLWLDTPRKCEEFLRLGRAETWRRLTEACGLGEHPLSRRIPERVAAGSAVCLRLCPGEKLLRHLTEQVPDLIRVLPPLKNGDPVILPDRGELVVNDEGTAARVGKDVRLIAGPLLERRRRDPRMEYWPGDVSRLRETTLNDPAYREHLKGLGIERVSWQACGYPIRTEGPGALVLPFYQVNTATFCTLAAAVLRGDRGDQRPGEDCGELCREHCFLYPRAQKVLAAGNTLYGCDRRVLTRGEALRELLAPGIDRLVWSFPG